MKSLPPNVDHYIQKHSSKEKELKTLRDICLKAELSETIKWGAPAYTLSGKNVVSIVAFKDYTAIWFHQGIFLKDPLHILITTDNDSSKALRSWKFCNIDEIDEKNVKSYIEEAIKNTKAGKKKKPEKKELKIPSEFLKIFEKNPELKRDFHGLTPGRQRDFADYVAAAKRETTREQRVEKCIPLIREGKGLNDKYRN